MYFMPDYHPEWLVGCAAIRYVHGQRLAALVGRRLNQVWLLWNLKSDSYFGDGPVIMDFDGEQVEICQDVSPTWAKRGNRWSLVRRDISGGIARNSRASMG
ncbi:hypothetical protein ACIBQX_41615 [Nonomuraea sp. NPDC049714]|uniref:hypothetical protein n=1 Tax=Nonomuraea sp. NPDC049714 TaxID=3364357 RepID=UPI003794A6B7